MSKRKVLLIVEGRKQEVKLFKALFACYHLNFGYEIYPYETNIYELYEKMFSNGEQEELSLLGVLKERANEEDRQLFDQDYSDILLVFDYEPQDDRFSESRLEEMQRYFSESTDTGKLYVNYPMVEACKHFDRLPDLEFLDRTVALKDVPCYKRTVGTESRYQNYERDFSRPDVDEMIALTAIKAARLSGAGPDDPSGGLYELDHEKVLRAQNYSLCAARRIWVLGMCLLFILDYSPGMIDFEGLAKKGRIPWRSTSFANM